MSSFYGNLGMSSFYGNLGGGGQDSAEVAGDNLFVSITPTDHVESKVWHFKEWTVTVANGKLDHSNPEFRMYYVKANGRKTAIKVIAEYAKTTDSGDVYFLSFKAPNATGQFPVQLHAIDDGEESEEYIQTIMKVW